MKTPLLRFKFCLAALPMLGLAVALGLGLCGCASSKPKTARAPKPDDELATLRFHLAVNPDLLGRTIQVPVFRARPMLVTVENSPFLDERYVTNAVVVDDLGGFSLKIQFGDTGTRLLEQYSTANRGRRCAIFSQWGEKGAKTNYSRWLSAPLFTRTISDGAFTFTPDTSRQEAEDIARGVVKLSEKYKKKGEW
jgi:hypothetical protein